MKEKIPQRWPVETNGPLAVALSGGGARAAYQVGVLSGIVERTGGDLPIPIITGVSAGAINAASLAGHQGSLKSAVEHLEKAWLNMSVHNVFDARSFDLVSSSIKWGWMFLTGNTVPWPRVRGILDTRPLREMLSRLLDIGGIDDNIASGRLRALALSATSYATGRTVTFVHGIEGIRTWERAGRIAVRASIGVDHVLASSALPILFPAIGLGKNFYGDGSSRQTAPLAPAVHLGAGRILAISLRYKRSRAEEAEVQIRGYPPPAQVLGLLLNSIFLNVLEADAERLERVNRSMAALAPGQRHPDRLRPIRLRVLHPSRDLGKLSHDLAHCLPQGLRFLIRGLGSRRLRSPDFLSYLLFERPYVERLLELGRADALAQWDVIAPIVLDDASVKSTA
jgi:NTE family protein